MPAFSISGQIVDLYNRRLMPGIVSVAAGRIAEVVEEPGATGGGFILPGFIDAHVHIESSMMAPSEFARFAVRHGTVATVSDPHEIANVLGIDGVRLMVANGRQTPFKFHFGAPSCVPATRFETAGAELSAGAIAELFERDGLGYLSEMMNYPGVLARDPLVMDKLAVAQRFRRPIDGHAPGLRGEQAREYAAAGISTDHECFTLDEALDKIADGMRILIREGSAAKNFAALHPLLDSHPGSCMFCSDDLHPDALLAGQIDRLVARAVAEGHDLFDVLRAACLHPIQHYALPVGTLRPGDPADFVVVEDLRSFRVLSTYINGERVFDGSNCTIDRVMCPAPNRFGAEPIALDALRVPDRGRAIRVIQAQDGQLITNEVHVPPRVEGGAIVPDVAQDVLKIAVVNRYRPAPPAVAFVRGFGLRRGAIAASVAHDSHNVVAVGATDADLLAAINAVIEMRGGLAVADRHSIHRLPLELAGLTSRNGDDVAAGYSRLDAAARGLGSPLTAPFMTLSFMALLVIPALKLSDQGLFDGRRFEMTSLYVD